VHYILCMRVHQCPKCELRYRDDHEVKQHLVDDHGVDPEELEHHLSGERHGTRPHRDVPAVDRESSSP
jgi:hypothetical protein